MWDASRRFVCTVAKMMMYKVLESCRTNLVIGIASEASKGALNCASGRVDVGFEGRRLIVRHFL